MSSSSDANGAPEVSIILESYNHAEGSSLDRLGMSLRAALSTASNYGTAEVLLADTSGDPGITAVLTGDLAEVRQVEAKGQHYEEAKLAAFSQARGQYILFLDGDVIPDREDWAAVHVSALRNGAVATAGFTRYEGGFLQKVFTILDWGFLLSRENRDARCYASNNAGFRAETLRDCPIPAGPLRSQCYLHAELLRRGGTPVRLVGEAAVHHEKQGFWDERFRQGYDRVGVCWTNRSLPEARLLRLGPLAAPLFYAREVLLDWRRLLSGRRDLGFGAPQTALAFVLMPVLRLADLAGIVRALVARG